jgi:arylsulfatase A-like enzyme
VRTRAIGPAICALLLTACFGGDAPQRNAGSDAEASPGGASASPDILLIVVDTLRADAIFDPSGLVDTPALDQLRRDGVGLRQAFAHAPITLPSHMAMFTSRLPFEIGVLNNGVDFETGTRLLTEHLAAHGYETRGAVSLATLRSPNSIGMLRGFLRVDVDFFMMDQAPRALARMRARMAERDPAEPQFFFAHFSDPHGPYTTREPGATVEIVVDDGPPRSATLLELGMVEQRLELSPGRHTVEYTIPSEHYRKLVRIHHDGRRLDLEWELAADEMNSGPERLAFELDSEAPSEVKLTFWFVPHHDVAEVRRRYLEEVAYVDAAIGQLLDDLRAAGTYDDTLIVFTSDHGEALGEHSFVGHVECLHDHLLNVPLIVKPPSGHPALEALTQRGPKLAPLVDLVPTILDIAGLPPLPDAGGESWVTGGTSLLIAETHRPAAKRDLVCVRDDRYKLIHDGEADTFVMYDLVADPQELRDVFAALGDERKAWQAQLRRISAAALEARTAGGGPSAEAEETLKALGY